MMKFHDPIGRSGEYMKRPNQDEHWRSKVYMRSIATRAACCFQQFGYRDGTLSDSQFKLIIVETAGIGQSDSAITDLIDYSLCNDS